MSKTNKRILVKGIGASPGVAKGQVRIAYSPEEAYEKMQGNDILVVPSTDPTWTIYMQKAKALVANTGGLLCHASIVSRELGIPCIVGTIDATHKLKDRMSVIVDGSEGIVFEDEGT